MPELELMAGEIISTLNDTIDKAIATDEQYDEMVLRISELAEQYSYEEAKIGLDKYVDVDNQNSLSDGPDMFRRIRSICATMLVLEYGMKNDAIVNMKINDINLNVGIIKRGRYHLQLAHNLKNIFF